MITVPPNLLEAIRRDNALYEGILAALEEFTPWIEASTRPFFREFTDHGTSHIQEVLATIDSLIPESARLQITAADGAMIVLASLLHDVALHLTEDGFRRLIDPNHEYPWLGEYGDRPWNGYWEAYLQEASRFDGQMLDVLFGDTRPVRRPPNDPSDWNQRDYRLIGDFLRRFHHQIAHSIAIHGVPGPEGNRLRLEGVSADFADLSGIIARSHGISLRESITYVRRYDVREYRGVHSVYVMALLRVSDYLQLQASRAPRQLLSVYRLRSPLSQREWDTHAAILDIRRTHEDPEAIYVDARPASIRTFIRVSEWLRGIQSELDQCWAVLGEIYGRYPGLRDLGLSLRRVRSNLDDIQLFSKSVDYIPQHAAFSSANSDLLKLLVGPLYGNRPEIGVRELVQNALDATREALFTVAKSSGDTNQIKSVQARIEEHSDGTWSFVITDYGIGMSPDVICNYFLRAGASFRKSDSWRAAFETESGNANVLRSGRFGIGAVATFLLGPEMHVRTRHIDSDGGALTFNATLDSPEIELRRDLWKEGPGHGTEIRVRISKQTAMQLGKTNSWDWYCLDDQLIDRVFCGTPLPQRFRLPQSKVELPLQWNRIVHSDYEDIQWTYNPAPSLTCNGIYVMSRARTPLFQDPDSSAEFATPNLSVFDPDGNLPLLLQRTGLAERRLPFYSELVQSVARDAVAYCLANAPEEPLSSITRDQYSRSPSGVILSGTGNWLPWVSTLTGVGWCGGWNIAEAGIKRLICFPRHKVAKYYPAIPDEYTGLVLHSAPGGIFPKSAIHLFFGTSAPQEQVGEFLAATSLRVKGRRLLIPREAADYVYKNAPKEISVSPVKSKLDRWVIFTLGDVGDSSPIIPADYDSQVSNSAIERAVVELFLNDDQPPDPEEFGIAAAWHQMIGRGLVPYESESRSAMVREFQARFPEHARNHF